MLRRPPLRSTLAVTAVAVALSGCATFSNTSQVADVDGAEISTDTFREYSDVFFADGNAFGTPPAADGRVDAEPSRNLLAAMVSRQLFRNFIDGEGVDITEQRDDYTAQLLASAPPGQGDVPRFFLELIAEINPELISEALRNAPAKNIDELREMYAQSPISVGLVCVRHILVATEDEAEDVRNELAAGADFGELAAERSSDEASILTGGALETPDSACIPLQGFDPSFTAGLLGAQEATPTEPIESTFGWHVILPRPWDEIGEAVGAAHQPGQSGQLLYDGYRVTAPVAVDARYGTWNPLASAIEVIG